MYDFLPGVTDAHHNYSHHNYSHHNYSHHNYSHHNKDPAKLAALTTISAWEVSVFAAFLQRLTDIPRGNGALLDATVAVMSSEVTAPTRTTTSTRP